MDHQETVNFLRRASKEQKLCYFVKTNATKAAKMMIENPSVNINSSNTLWYATTSDTTYYLKLMLARNDLNVNVRFRAMNEGPLHVAVRLKKYEHVKLLLADPRTSAAIPGYEYSATPLFKACIDADAKMLELLLDSKKDLNWGHLTSFSVPVPVDVFQFAKIALGVNQRQLLKITGAAADPNAPHPTTEDLEKMKHQAQCVKNAQVIFDMLAKVQSEILTKIYNKIQQDASEIDYIVTKEKDIKEKTCE